MFNKIFNFKQISQLSLKKCGLRRKTYRLKQYLHAEVILLNELLALPDSIQIKLNPLGEIIFYRIET
jgi:hypothetical protein